MSLETLVNHTQGTHVDLGIDIIHSSIYGYDPSEIEDILDDLHQYPELTCDIEAFSLIFSKAGIGTISFAWDEHNGIAFPVDYMDREEGYNKADGFVGTQSDNPEIKKLLRRFFETYKGKLTYHGGTYDIKILIYELFMENLLDNSGLLDGLECMYRSIDDTKLITYLATNSTAGNTLGLKPNSFEYTGNYAQEDIKDIRLIPLPDLLKYNLIDCLATWYVKNKNYPIMIADDQKSIYDEIMIPSMKLITHMELTGMPMDEEHIEVMHQTLLGVITKQKDILRGSQLIKDYEWARQREACVIANLLLKKKIRPIEDFYERFNPASNKQVQELLYDEDQFNLPIIDKTDSGAPAVGAKTLRKHLNSLNRIYKSTSVGNSVEQIKILEALVALSEADIILTNFVYSFMNKTIDKGDGVKYLHGNFNLGGTVSGRLSSSKVNLQNLPSSGSKYAKLVKKGFVAPEGWILCGADFSSLEDRISALTTKDPNKLKVYEDGYDGHCLRAFAYFPDKMSGIINTVSSINSIETKYPELRQDSKAPTFLLTYQGTYYGLMNNVGLSKEVAQAIEKAYHEMYVISDEWVQDKLEQASKDGYVTVAFGLRVRTPILKQTAYELEHLS